MGLCLNLKLGHARWCVAVRLPVLPGAVRLRGRTLLDTLRRAQKDPHKRLSLQRAGHRDVVWFLWLQVDLGGFAGVEPLTIALWLRNHVSDRVFPPGLA